jgi:ubiquinone/menaquinone biosynthesis C-methylase UbiE
MASVKAKEVFPAVFSRHADAYRERVMTPLRREEARGRLAVIELLDLRRGEWVLDLACGPGTLTYPLAGAVGSDGLVVATDLAEGMLRLAREDAPAQVGLARMDSERLGLQSAVFDAVACGHGLQFCPDLRLALSEARRVLKGGGRFAASFPARAAERPAFALLDEVFAELPPVPAVEDRSATLATLQEPGSLRGAVLEAGFQEAEVRRVEETITYVSPEELVSRVCGWWDLAWRLESVPAADQARLRVRAERELRERFGSGPLEVPGATHVLLARS